MTVAEALRAAAGRLAASSDTARLDAELLMAHALGISRSDMLLRGMGEGAPGSFDGLIDRRAAREPVAHILGWQEFYGRRFRVTRDTLIPRSDSEVLVDAALEIAPRASRVLDLGTGSGALLLSVLAETGAAGIGTDRSEPALAVARENALGLGMAARASFERRDWRAEGWTAGLGAFDLILCNPPYVEDGADLEPNVRDFEPAGALFAGPEGLGDYRIVVPQLRELMTDGGIAVLEIGHRQAEAVSTIGRDNGFAVAARRDLGGRERVLVLT
ncbi:peptide chain release factor N(5)-glutamine methyltransferase [Qipengyuania sp. MTN3-11]|uniref:peptide chain release factor N(5)-glutamine methyltransferase n=1 Tax=Qipengyuania sp. MTN3-11 TaxID=3056557 RepID=UPI0036F36E9E